MTVAGKDDGIDRADLEQLGDRFAVPGYRHEIDRVLDAVDQWPTFADAAGTDEQVTDQIREVHRRFRPR